MEFDDDTPDERLLRLRRVPIAPTLLVSLFQIDGSKRLAFEGLPPDAAIVDMAYFAEYDMIFAFVTSKAFEPTLVTGRPTIDLRNPLVAYQIDPLWLMVRGIDEPVRDLDPSPN